MNADDEREYVDYVSARLPRLHRAAYLLSGDAHRADGDPPSGLIGARWNLRTGELTTYPELKGVVVALSASGAIVASRSTLGEPLLATPDGQLVDLPRPIANTPYPGQVAAMSSNGLIVGTARAFGMPSVAVVWRLA